MHTLSVYSNPLNVMVEVSNFGVDDVPVTLSWTQQQKGVSYEVNIVPQVAAMSLAHPGTDSTSLQLTITYNTHFIVNILGTLCGQNVSSTRIELNYGKPLN